MEATHQWEGKGVAAAAAMMPCCVMKYTRSCHVIQIMSRCSDLREIYAAMSFSGDDHFLATGNQIFYNYKDITSNKK